MCVSVYICIYRIYSQYIQMHTCVCVYICIYKMHMCVCVCVCLYIYVFMYTLQASVYIMLPQTSSIVG